MEHNFNNRIVKPCLSLDDSIITGSAKDKFDKKINENREIIYLRAKLPQLNIANSEIDHQRSEKEEIVEALIVANKELAFQTKEKADRAAELIIANNEKEIRAAEFVLACKELAFQIRQKSNRASELVMANRELAFQIGDKADMAAKLAIANKKLAILNEEKNKRASELIIANKEQGEYFINISHELKTPLNVINSAAQLLRMYCNTGLFDEKKDSIINYIDSTTQNCYRLSKLINNIVDLSKIEAGFLKLNLSNNNIVEVVEKIVTSVTVFADNRNLNLIFDTNIEEKIIACDSEMIDRMVLNLISNAIKFSDASGEILVQVKDRNEFVEISVEDNGIGIEEKDLGIIFDRFKQVDKSLTRNAEGTGIGLSLVKSIAQLHGGSIEVESEVGKGSKFIVKLPSKNVCHESMLYDSNMKNENESIKAELSDVYL